MDHREPARIAADSQGREGVLDDADVPPRARFAKFEFVRQPRRLDWIRLAAGLAILASALGLAIYGGRIAVRTAVEWLHGQPQFRLPFSEIELDPPPPDWYLGGTKTFLDRVREAAMEDEILVVPALERDRLTTAFWKYAAWVKGVRSIEFTYPNHVRASLEYREPVARLIVKERGNKTSEFFLDDEGVVLPGADIAPEKRARLIDIGASMLKALVTPPAPGQSWKSVDNPELDRRVRAAAKLAGFFQAEPRIRDIRKFPGLGIYQINVDSSMGLLIWVERDKPLIENEASTVTYYTGYLWGEAPGEERPGDPDAADKWEMLRAHVESSKGPLPLPAGDRYWVFTRKGVIPYPSGKSNAG